MASWHRAPGSGEQSPRVADLPLALVLAPLVLAPLLLPPPVAALPVLVLPVLAPRVPDPPVADPLVAERLHHHLGQQARLRLVVSALRQECRVFRQAPMGRGRGPRPDSAPRRCPGAPPAPIARLEEGIDLARC